MGGVGAKGEGGWVGGVFSGFFLSSSSSAHDFCAEYIYFTTCPPPPPKKPQLVRTPFPLEKSSSPMLRKRKLLRSVHFTLRLLFPQSMGNKTTSKPNRVRVWPNPTTYTYHQPPPPPQNPSKTHARKHWTRKQTPSANSRPRVGILNFLERRNPAGTRSPSPIFLTLTPKKTRKSQATGIASQETQKKGAGKGVLFVARRAGCARRGVGYRLGELKKKNG